MEKLHQKGRMLFGCIHNDSVVKYQNKMLRIRGGGFVKTVVVIDGRSGRTGQLFIERVKAAGLPCELTAIGTNAIATSAMLKAGADAGATGENPVVVACRKADVIVGPIGILAADSLMGEVTPAMAVAVGQSDATKLLLPVSHCKNVVVGTQTLSLSRLMDEAVELLRAQLT